MADPTDTAVEVIVQGKTVKLYPVNVNDTDIFLHGTSSKKYIEIKSTGFLSSKSDEEEKNYSKIICLPGIYFEKYDPKGTYADYNSGAVTEEFVLGYCKTTCRRDGSESCVILSITGRNLNNLGCTIFLDPNNDRPFVRKSDGDVSVPRRIDSDASVFSILIFDKDIPLKYLKKFKEIPTKEIDNYIQKMKKSSMKRNRC